ncbi:MAG: sodium:proton antiporter [Streptococcaceae bacterium]|jgi:CPA1 family monovalent cation:H+ antiporter|nr:sodium:proton antiporter [Streptococcaceae bacterium]
MLHTVFYAIVFLLALVVSNVLNKIFPKLPLPLIQVAIGLILGFFGANHVVTVDPEIFLAFIIAPLLFREAEEAEVKRIFKHTRMILVLIFPLVFITALGVGYLTNALYSPIPLAAAIALGGTLAPTDAVVVSSLSERYNFPRRITSILKGEGMLNDASGIISFQIALTALTTGYFSIVHASVNLIYSAVGGVVIGLVLVWLDGLILTILEDVAANDTVGYLLLELALPLAAFLLADVLHMSGIIAVVVAGVMQANGLKKTSLFDAQVAKVKNTVWETLTFLLNSVVFIFLGIELYQLITPILAHNAYSNLSLLVLVLAITASLFVVRFLILTLYYSVVAKRRKRLFMNYWNDIMLLSFAGSKGTIGIAAILLLPRSATETQPLLVFLCAAVTGLSFLVGLFIVPLFTTRKVEEVNNLQKIAILTDVIAELTQDQAKATHKTGYTIAIDAYQERIQRLIVEQETASVSTDFNDLQLLIMRMEVQGLETALRDGEISMYTYRTYQRYLHSLETTVVHHLVSSLQFAFAVTWRAIHLLISNLLHIEFSLGRRAKYKPTDKTRTEITELYFKNTELVMAALENLEGVYDAQLIDFLQAERLRTAAFVADGGHITRMMNKAHPNNLTEMMRAYYLERKIIFEYEERGDLTAHEAQEMRQNVNVMEDYSLVGERPSLLIDFLSYGRKDRERAV